MVVRMLSALALFMTIAAPGSLAQSEELTPADASRIFEEARVLSSRDNGYLWGRALYGPMILVEQEGRRLVANENAEGLLPDDEVFVGRLPDSVAIANTALSWAGREWTMLMWPLPEDPFNRRALIAHELWHRIQDEVGFPGGSAPNLHLGTRDGRVWLQLESRALAAALRSEGEAARSHVRDALLFRAMRMQAFPKAAEEERILLMHEGLAQYTGYALSGRPVAANRHEAARELESLVGMPTFVRSFAYPMGAAYGLLLDEIASGWRASLRASDDLTTVAARAVDFESPVDVEAAAATTAERYDGPALFAEEDRMEREREARLDRYRQRFVAGPTLELPFVRMNVQFNPQTVDALDDLGKVYPSLRLSDEWGVLSVEGGALIPSDWSRVVVPAPTGTLDSVYVGDGYSLELATGWEMVAGHRRGDRTLMQTTFDEPEQVTFRTNDGVTIYGDLYLAHEISTPMILLFHQGASNARAEYRPLVARLTAAGFNLLAIDQRRGGNRLGGHNRTVAHLAGESYSYCDCYADMEAALDYARNTVGARQIIAWGSSYSAALVFKLGVEHPDEIAGLVAFSPASGEPMAGCAPERYAAETDLPVLVLRPAREMELEHVASQFHTLRKMGHRMFIADPAVHGSSMLNPYRVDGDVERTWREVLDFLSEIP